MDEFHCIIPIIIGLWLKYRAKSDSSWIYHVELLGFCNMGNERSIEK